MAYTTTATKSQASISTERCFLTLHGTHRSPERLYNLKLKSCCHQAQVQETRAETSKHQSSSKAQRRRTSAEGLVASKLSTSPASVRCKECTCEHPLGATNDQKSSALEGRKRWAQGGLTQALNRLDRLMSLTILTPSQDPGRLICHESIETSHGYYSQASLVS